MGNFEIAVSYVLFNEQGLEDNKNDHGGISNFGISLRLLKSIPLDRLRNYSIFETPTEDTIRNLKLKQAVLIYRGEFWVHADFDRIDDQEICNYLFDSAINLGIAPAVKCIQRALWAISQDKSNIVEDGILGEKTVSLINYYGDKLLPILRSERAAEYKLIVAAHPNDAEFLHGWLRRAYEK